MYDNNTQAPSGPCPPTKNRLIVKRGGKAITGTVPKPVVLVDTREQAPMRLARFNNWIADEKVVEASYEDIKTPYTFARQVEAHPNGVTGTLDAIEARFGIPVIYTSRKRDLADEKAASWLSKVFTYWWLESNGLGRVLQEGDL